MTAAIPWSPPEIAPKFSTVVLKPREADVLTGLHYGLSNLQIGNRLHLSEMTVKTYLKSLYRALGARDRCHAVALSASERVTITVKGRP